MRIPISPRADYFNRVFFIARSIKEFYPGARFRVSIGEECRPFDPASRYAWSDKLDIDWRWVDSGDSKRWSGTAHPYIATMMDRFKPPFVTEYVLMLDADVIAVAPFDELFEHDGIAGVMAHGAPFQGDHASTWQRLFQSYGLAEPVFEHEHSGWQSMFADERLRFSPFYLNTGVVFGSRKAYEELYEPYMRALDFVRATLDSYFFEQIALTLALQRTAVPVKLLPLRFNFPNQFEFEQNHPDELRDVRMLHFLRTDIVGRERDFADYAAVTSLTARGDLSGSNEILRSRIRALGFSTADLERGGIP